MKNNLSRTRGGLLRRQVSRDSHLLRTETLPFSRLQSLLSRREAGDLLAQASLAFFRPKEFHHGQNRVSCFSVDLRPNQRIVGVPRTAGVVQLELACCCEFKNGFVNLSTWNPLCRHFE